MVYSPYLFEPKPDYLDNPEPYRFYETWQAWVWAHHHWVDIRKIKRDVKKSFLEYDRETVQLGDS